MMLVDIGRSSTMASTREDIFVQCLRRLKIVCYYCRFPSCGLVCWLASPLHDPEPLSYRWRFLCSAPGSHSSTVSLNLSTLADRALDNSSHSTCVLFVGWSHDRSG